MAGSGIVFHKNTEGFLLREKRGSRLLDFLTITIRRPVPFEWWGENLKPLFRKVREGL
jgi:hypothetical protein